MSRLLKVRDKQKKLVWIKPTKVHKKFKKFERKINYVVKPRQVFFTTFMESDNFLDCVLKKDGLSCLFISLDQRVAEEVFDRVHTMKNEFPIPMILPRQKKESTKKLSWENGGVFDAVTCKNDRGPDAAKTLGRSCTTQRIHITEAAYMKFYREFLDGLMDSAPFDTGARVCFESTGNGAQGGFYDDVMEVVDKGKSIAPNIWVLGDKMAQFVAYWEHYEYRRNKDPLKEFVLDTEQKKVLKESEKEHLEEMKKDSELDPEEYDRVIYWRRWHLLNKKNFLEDPEGAVISMDKEYPATLRHAFHTTGSAFLNLRLIDNNREKWKIHNHTYSLPIPMGITTGETRDQVRPIKGDKILVWEPPDEDDHESRYVIGGDPAHGMEGRDDSCAYVFDRVKRFFCAAIFGKFDPEEFAELMEMTAIWYHRAFIIFERNDPGVGVAQKIWELGYENVFKYKDNLDRYAGYGWRSNFETRAEAMNLLKSGFQSTSKAFQMPHIEWYRQAAVFVTPPGKKKPEAQAGHHDDCILGSAITLIGDAFLPQPEEIQTKKTYGPGTIGAIIDDRLSSNKLRTVT